MTRFWKMVSLIIVVSLTSFFNVSFAADGQTVTLTQEQMLGNHQVVKLSETQPTAIGEDPVLKAIEKAKQEVKDVKKSSVEKVAPVTKNAELKPNYKVTSVHDSVNLSGSSTYGPTKKSDHLWQIARQVRPQHGSLSQTAFAIYKANPEAFLNMNINGLKHGKVLEIPSGKEILSIDPQIASCVIVAHNKAWHHKGTTHHKKVKHYVKKNTRFAPSVSSKIYAAKVKRIAEQVKMPITAEQKNAKKQFISKAKIIKHPIKFHRKNLAAKVRHITNGGSDSDLANRVSMLEKNVQNFREVVGQHISKLEESNLSLQAQLSGVEKNFNTLRRKVEKKQVDNGKFRSHFFTKLAVGVDSFNDYMVQTVGGKVYVGIAIVILVLLIFWLVRLVWRTKFKNRQIYKTSEDYAEPNVTKPVDVSDIAEDEYDFLSGPEGMTSKLDLARVYINMGDKDQARELLNEVLADGDDKQKEDAREIMKKI